MTPSMQRKIARAAAAMKAYGAREVYIFGSLAEGTFTRHSDIDMAVTGLPPEKYFNALGEAMDILGKPLDLIDLDDECAFTHFFKMKGKLRRVI